MVPDEENDEHDVWIEGSDPDDKGTLSDALDDALKSRQKA
jgi:hypothetical protein